MTYYPMNKYLLKGFQKSNTHNKKYDAIIMHKITKRYIRVPFGDKRYQQYKDTTGMKLYSHLNHNDSKRRRLYKLRHKTYLKHNNYSPGYFSYNYLW